MKKEPRIVVASDSGLSVRFSSDILEMLCAAIGTAGLVLTENDLGPEFFDLHSGLAGELFQKFTNYKLRLAIVLPDPDVHGERFRELAYEHRSHTMIRFVRSIYEAETWLHS